MSSNKYVSLCNWHTDNFDVSLTLLKLLLLQNYLPLNFHPLLFVLRKVYLNLPKIAITQFHCISDQAILLILYHRVAWCYWWVSSRNKWPVCVQLIVSSESRWVSKVKLCWGHVLLYFFNVLKFLQVLFCRISWLGMLQPL